MEKKKSMQFYLMCVLCDMGTFRSEDIKKQRNLYFYAKADEEGDSCRER
jgi:hypothetical protein